MSHPHGIVVVMNVTDSLCRGCSGGCGRYNGTPHGPEYGGDSPEYGGGVPPETDAEVAEWEARAAAGGNQKLRDRWGGYAFPAAAITTTAAPAAITTTAAAPSAE